LGLSGFHQLEGVFEISAGLLLAPGAVGADLLEMKECLVTIERMALVTSILEKDWLYALYEKLKIGGVGGHPTSQRQGEHGVESQRVDPRLAAIFFSRAFMRRERRSEGIETGS
jgi:hypothetical protein